MSVDEEEDFSGFDETELALPTPEVLKSTKNKDILAYKGFVFYQNRKPVRKFNVQDHVIDYLT